MLTQGYFPYMNYGMFPVQLSEKFSGHPEEAVNYLQLFELGRSFYPKQADILEIGCGFGYGAQLVAGAAKPKTLLSIDKSQKAISYAIRYMDTQKVTYRHEAFSDRIAPENSLDVIYTVESGGKFPREEDFETAIRLLKKGGIFLIANINTREGLENKRRFAAKAGFTCHAAQDVTPQVKAYLSSDKKMASFNASINKMPFYAPVLWRLFRSSIKEFARLPGSKSFDQLGVSEFYYHFCFIKTEDK